MTTADQLKDDSFTQNQRLALFEESEANEMQTRWRSIQGNFVDQPRVAVQEADALVSSLINRLNEVFADQRSRLESGWEKGQDASTEDLRLTLQRYRSLFSRLLSV